jgi:hypothetical protein
MRRKYRIRVSPNSASEFFPALAARGIARRISAVPPKQKQIRIRRPAGFLLSIERFQLAITTSGGANSWRSDFVELLRQKRVVLLPDTDEAGMRYAERIQASLDHAGIQHKTVYLDGYKNVREFLERNPPQALVTMVGCDWLQLPVPQLPELVGSVEDI